MTDLIRLAEKRAPRFVPANCPHCEYDRRFPGFEAGGWIQQDNNGPIVSCPVCNDDGSHPFDLAFLRSLAAQRGQS